MKANFYLNGSKIQPPDNFKELSVELNYDKDIAEAQVSTNKWRFVRDNVDTIISHQTNGITGGVGVFEGIPFKIELEHYGTKVKLFDGYIDLSDNVQYSCDEVVASAKEKKGVDWLNDNADGFSFEYLDSIGLIDHDKYVFVPYCISDLPQGRDIIITTLTLVVISQEIKREIDYYTSKTPNLSNPFTATIAIEMALHAIYTIALIATIVRLIADLINYTIQPVKYHAGMYVKDLMQAGASKMGYTFVSSIFNSPPFNKLVLVPEKYFQDDKKGVLGFQLPQKTVQKGYYNGTFGDLIRTFKTIFNAKVIVVGNTMYFEREDYNISTAKYVVPSLRNDYYSLNTEDFRANTLIKFATDINEKNTIKDYTGNAYQITTVPIVTINSGMLLMKNLDTIAIPFSLGRRKQSLTFPEELVRDFADIFSALLNGFISVFNAIISAINAVINFFNKVVNAIKALIKIPKAGAPSIPSIPYVDLGATIEDRIGMLLLENDFIDSPKLLLVNENKANNRKTDLSVNNSQILSAKYLYENYHFISNFVGSGNKHGQYYKYELKNVPFCFDDFEKVRVDNLIKDKSNTIGKIDSLKWNVYEQTAEIKYRINKKYSTNLQNKYTESNGK